jgi:hypothetical protein
MIVFHLSARQLWAARVCWVLEKAEHCDSAKCQENADGSVLIEMSR